MALLYAQERRGQKLHLVIDLGGDTVSGTPLCGRRVSGWRMSINAPLGKACKNCLRRCTEKRIAAINLAIAQDKYRKAASPKDTKEGGA